VTNAEIARALGLAPRTVRDLIAGWLEEGWLHKWPTRRANRAAIACRHAKRIGGLLAE